MSKIIVIKAVRHFCSYLLHIRNDITPFLNMQLNKLSLFIRLISIILYYEL